MRISTYFPNNIEPAEKVFIATFAGMTSTSQTIVTAALTMVNCIFVILTPRTVVYFFW